MKGRLALLAALVAVLGYAAFAAGAARHPSAGWFEIAVAVIALAATAGALLGGWSVRAPGQAWVGVVLLAAFAAWSAATLAWSINPSGTWEELNRALAYAGVAGVAVAVAGALPRAIERFALGWLAVAVAAALYALGGKVAPGLSVGPVDLDHTAQISRLRAPLEYWNALALLCVLALPVALQLAVGADRRLRVRVTGLAAAYLLIVVVGLTYSRGAIAALAVAAAVLTIGGRRRLPALVALLLAGVAAAVPLAFAFTSETLKTNGAPLAERAQAGLILGGLMLTAAGALLAAGGWLARRDARLVVPAHLRRRALALAAATTALLVVVLGFGAARSERGLRVEIDRAVEGFTETRADRQFDPARLLSTSSTNRYGWWQEALGAWADRPLHGWGAGSFTLLHLRYRDDPLPVTHAHSVPLQMMAETGIVGLLLAYGAILALLAAAIARLRRLDGRERELAVALLAAVVAWLVHGFYDWDWNIPAVTAPALAMLALIAGRRREREVLPGVVDTAPGRAGRAAVVAVATVAAAAVVASATLPALAQSKAQQAAAQASSADAADLAEAAAAADLAARLDPLSTRPLFVSAVLAQRRGRLLDARRDLLEAADRNPHEPAVWVRLILLAIRLADREGAVEAMRRLFEVDPLAPYALTLPPRVLTLLAPPSSSATATGTPLRRVP